MIKSITLTFLLFFNLLFAQTETIPTEQHAKQLVDETFQNIPEPQFQHTFLRMLLILIAVIFLLIVSFWILKKLVHIRVAQTNANKAIKILEKRAISPKTVLYLVELNNEKILIAESHLEIRKIHSSP